MLFCSKAYLIFFCVVFFTYWSLPWQRARVWLLLGASFYFYASWNKWLALIICVSTAIDYALAHGMDSATTQRWRKLYLTTSIVGNLGLLCYFKYMNFFLKSLEEGLRAMGAESSMPVLQLILPIGISFYTFEAISYTVDVYRRRIPAERNLSHFMLFITFFPHLVAGPIVRARDFLPQVNRPKHWDWARINLGLQLFVVGLFKKLVIADRMVVYTDAVFATPDSYGTGAIWLAVVAYAIQIYCDFSGYSDMAIGTAHMFGYKLARNFDLPYLSANVSEFWHRWHISLSTWLRDYLFIPLGGSRGSRWNTALNLMIVMALGGLWHGAAWTFVVWGLLHGLYLVVHREFRSFCEGRPRLNGLLQTGPGLVLRIGTTFGCVCMAWVFFRAQTFEAALHILRRMFSWELGLPAPTTYHCLATLFIVMLFCHVMTYVGAWNRLAKRTPAPVLGLSQAFLFTAALALTPFLGKVFIYFQF